MTVLFYCSLQMMMMMMMMMVIIILPINTVVAHRHVILVVRLHMQGLVYICHNS
jgi:hypothetical protein